MCAAAWRRSEALVCSCSPRDPGGEFRRVPRIPHLLCRPVSSHPSFTMAVFAVDSFFFAFFFLRCGLFISLKRPNLSSFSFGCRVVRSPSNAREGVRRRFRRLRLSFCRGGRVACEPRDDCKRGEGGRRREARNVRTKRREETPTAPLLRLRPARENAAEAFKRLALRRINAPRRGQPRLDHARVAERRRPRGPPSVSPRLARPPPPVRLPDPSKAPPWRERHVPCRKTSQMHSELPPWGLWALTSAIFRRDATVSSAFLERRDGPEARTGRGGNWRGERSAGEREGRDGGRGPDSLLPRSAAGGEAPLGRALVCLASGLLHREGVV